MGLNKLKTGRYLFVYMRMSTSVPVRAGCAVRCAVFFLYFIFLFFTKIYFYFRNLQEYTPAAPLPGSRGISAKSFAENLRLGPWRTGRPTAGRLDLAARLRGDHLPFPSKRVAPSFGLPPSFGSKIPGKNTRFVVTLFIHYIMV